MPYRFDIVAGLTAAAVVLPKAMAYATIAGLPVAVGLYTVFVPGVIYGLLGSSRVLRQHDDDTFHSHCR
jgi:SulP family sulfate permease